MAANLHCTIVKSLGAAIELVNAIIADGITLAGTDIKIQILQQGSVLICVFADLGSKSLADYSKQ